MTTTRPLGFTVTGEPVQQGKHIHLSPRLAQVQRVSQDQGPGILEKKTWRLRLARNLVTDPEGQEA